ncbi:hypothetical protein KQX54_015005 [Cotesia glomerata]|uniref:Uncharacterized protein n=1 Tax=Cotesia glomerata TaxID=32391 RepID=A0AAV7IL02_COTGL|nr:hypothetical protein KQX54_015005 [Cotesia glomerata]
MSDSVTESIGSSGFPLGAGRYYCNATLDINAFTTRFRVNKSEHNNVESLNPGGNNTQAVGDMELDAGCV